jgi:prophage regulatory protein
MQRTVTKQSPHKPQKKWLRRSRMDAGARDIEPLKIDLGPQPRLLKKSKVLEISGVSYVTLWEMMRDGRFPRSRVVGGRSMWVSSEVQAWLDGLPVRALKGEAVAG